MVRVSRPAPASSTTETAICATTSPRWRRCRRTPVVVRRAPAAIHEPNVPSFGNDATNDSSSATAADSASAKPNTTTVEADLIRPRSNSVARASSNSRTPPSAMTMPSAAPESVSRRFSTSISRRRRNTPAPSAARTTSSCSRRTPRISVRFTTFAAEMISTNAAEAMSSQSVSRARSPRASLNGITAMR